MKAKGFIPHLLSLLFCVYKSVAAQDEDVVSLRAAPPDVFAGDLLRLTCDFRQLGLDGFKYLIINHNNRPAFIWTKDQPQHQGPKPEYISRVYNHTRLEGDETHLSVWLRMTSCEGGGKFKKDALYECEVYDIDNNLRTAEAIVTVKHRERFRLCLKRNGTGEELCDVTQVYQVEPGVKQHIVVHVDRALKLPFIIIKSSNKTVAGDQHNDTSSHNVSQCVYGRRSWIPMKLGERQTVFFTFTNRDRLHPHRLVVTTQTQCLQNLLFPQNDYRPGGYEYWQLALMGITVLLFLCLTIVIAYVFLIKKYKVTVRKPPAMC